MTEENGSDPSLRIDMHSCPFGGVCAEPTVSLSWDTAGHWDMVYDHVRSSYRPVDTKGLVRRKMADLRSDESKRWVVDRRVYPGAGSLVFRPLVNNCPGRGPPSPALSQPERSTCSDSCVQEPRPERPLQALGTVEIPTDRSTAWHLEPCEITPLPGPTPLAQSTPPKFILVWVHLGSSLVLSGRSAASGLATSLSGSAFDVVVFLGCMIVGRSP